MAEERRIVTVLFADMAGPSALAEARDPEDVRALQTRYYDIARAVVSEHGGTLEKFVGDAVMAVFGLPQAHGDDAQRAMSAALDIRDRVRSDPKLARQQTVRIGVNTGEVVATRDDGATDFLITGDAVNVAARLQQTAEPWAILCGERTARAARDRFTLGPPTQIEVKGKRLPLQALPLLGRAAEAPPSRLPLVGRDDDLAQLELVARRAFTDRRPFLVSLIAPAGTGKTRLVEEFLHRLPGVAPGATVAVSQCLPYGQRVTYWPLRALLLRLVGLREEAAPEAVREEIQAWLHDRAVEAPERAADLLAATIGAGEPEVVDRAALFAAWRTAIEAAARRSPLVLVFEDLHWSSDSLLDLVEVIAQPRGDAGVLIITLTRPELLDRRPAWGGGRRNYVALSLEPLADDAVAELVRHMGGAGTPHIVERVVARAEGNPFFAGEIVQSIKERVQSLSDVAAVEHALATLPDTIQATVLARLDLLEPAERRVLQLGAVFGRAFRADAIAALGPDLGTETDALLDRLVGKDLVRPSAGGSFAFRHILIREVAYQTLLRAERAELHAAAARRLEAPAGSHEDALAELIAYHFREAATLTGATKVTQPDVAEVRRKAVRWLSRAADVAAAGAATAEAARHLRAAIELAATEELPELQERLGDVSGGDAGAEAYRVALGLCRRLGRPADQELRVLGSLLTRYMRFQGTVGNRPSEEEIQRLRTEGRALLPRARDEEAIAGFLIADGFYPFWRGAQATPAEIAEAEASTGRGLEIADRLDDARLRSAALDALTCCAQARGAWAWARQFAQRRLAFEDRLDLHERLDAHTMVAWASALLGDLAEADRAAAAALALFQTGQVHWWGLHSAAWRAYTLTLLGRWDEALAVAEHARKVWAEGGLIPAAYCVHGFIAALDVGRARHDGQLVDRYRTVLEEILKHFAADSLFGRLRPYARGDLDLLEGEVVRDFAAIPRARQQLVERTLSLCADLGRALAPDALRPIVASAAVDGLRLLEAQARRALGLATHDPAELGRALAIFEETRARPYAARVRCELALLTGSESELETGLQVLEALGDVDQLGRMERARGRSQAAP
jgi:predicted ATPase/class 3 adenylate cyclase